MRDAHQTNAMLARAMVIAFRDNRRDTAEALLAPDFTFTSPYDDAISRATFFERCWPNNRRVRTLAIERIAADADGAFVTYLFTSVDGDQFRNTEYLTVTGGRITRTDVYFGATYRDGRFVAQTVPGTK